MQMNLQQRIDLLSRLGEYMRSSDETWLAAKERASRENNWFIPAFVDAATNHIANTFLQKHTLTEWVSKYPVTTDNSNPKKVGIVMAGNIPLVRFVR